VHLLRKLLPYLWGAVAVVLLQLGWVFFTRHQADRRMEDRVREHQDRAEARNGPVPSGSALRIPWFYANSGEIVRGNQAVICYGVENAANVRLEPPVESLAPAYNRCFAVLPQQTTTYTLVAQDSEGASVSASLRVEVKPPPPSILFVTISAKEIRRGQPWLFCYGVRNATAARLEPTGMKLTPVEKRCLRMFPVRTTDFTLVASDDLGRTDREKFTVTVR
jgi:hypothetical protein